MISPVFLNAVKGIVKQPRHSLRDSSAKTLKTLSSFTCSHVIPELGLGGISCLYNISIYLFINHIG